MKAKHTPAPWAIRDMEVIGPYQSHKSICEITGNFMDDDEAKANLRLIKAAPDLLEALQKVKDDYTLNLTLEVEALINAAIKKATGAE